MYNEHARNITVQIITEVRLHFEITVASDGSGRNVHICVYHVVLYR